MKSPLEKLLLFLIPEPWDIEAILLCLDLIGFDKVNLFVVLAIILGKLVFVYEPNFSG